jgi:hypothetical protein
VFVLDSKTYVCTVAVDVKVQSSHALAVEGGGHGTEPVKV